MPTVDLRESLFAGPLRLLLVENVAVHENALLLSLPDPERWPMRGAAGLSA